MTITLDQSLFENSVYVVSYGLKKVTFTIIDENYSAGPLAAQIKRMICDVQSFDAAGNLLTEVFGSLVIGLGDSNVSVTSTDSSLLGLLMSSDNMASCSVELYE